MAITATDALARTAVNSIAALKSTNISAYTGGEHKLVTGYYATNYDGGGEFRYNASSSVTDDAGTVIAPNAGSGRWERIFSGAVSVEWFGAKGDGTTNDQPAFVAALSYLANTPGMGALILNKPTYKLNSGITVLVNKHSVLAPGGAILDFSSMTSGTAVTISSTDTWSTTDFEAHEIHTFQGIKLYGPWNVSVTGLALDGGSTNFASHFTARNCAIMYFSPCLTYGSGAWATMFRDCIFISSTGKCITTVGGVTSTGERLVFDGCVIYNSPVGVEHTLVGTSMYFTNTSFDYCPRQLTCTGGHIYLDRCWIEDNSDTNNWLYVSGVDSGIKAKHCDFVMTGARSTNTLFYSDSSCARQGLEIESSEFHINASYSLPRLVSGTGRVQARGLTYRNATPQVPLATVLNAASDGSFDTSAALNDWALSTPPPTISATVFAVGTGSAKIQPTVNGQQLFMTRDTSAAAGMMCQMSYRLRLDALTGTGESFIVYALWLDTKGALIRADSKSYNATQSFTLEHANWISPAPPGTVYLRVAFYTTTWQTTYIAYVDDVTVNLG